MDTHSDTHTLALIDEHGRPLATQTFTADPTGYERLVAMIGDPDACLGVGVEGTNSYGAAPARRLVKAGYDVHEVLRPKRSVRRRDGKSDPIDALAAARSVLAGDGTSVPKSADGWVEALRAPDAERAQPVTATAALSDSATGLPATARNTSGNAIAGCAPRSGCAGSPHAVPAGTRWSRACSLR